MGNARNLTGGSDEIAGAEETTETVETANEVEATPTGAAEVSSADAATEITRRTVADPSANVKAAAGKGAVTAAGKAATTTAGKGTGKKKRNKWTVVLVLAIIVLVASLVALGLIGFSYFQGQQKYEKLEEYTTIPDGDGTGAEPTGLMVDWNALRALNPDVVAWLYVPNTSINYPVVRGADNEYYLTHDFDGDQGWLANFGAIFMDANNAPGWTDDAYFIYGHHMNDGSMFADIAGMTNQARFDECRTVYLLSPDGDFKLRTFSLVHCAGTDPIVQLKFASQEDRVNYIQDKLDRSVVFASSVPAPETLRKIFAFATCDNLSDGRYVLYAYIEKTTAEGLDGVVGFNGEGEEPDGLVNDLHTE